MSYSPLIDFRKLTVTGNHAHNVDLPAVIPVDHVIGDQLSQPLNHVALFALRQLLVRTQ